MAKSAAAPKQYDPLKDGVPRRPIGLFVIGGLLVVALIAGIVIAATRGGDDKADAVAFRAVTITGAAIDQFPAEAQGIADPATDPAVGKVVPKVEGETFTGEPVTRGASGTPQIILILAHWCPFCQEEVPKVVEWRESGVIPDDIEVNAISTAVDRARGNYPPASWLERESWKDPVLADDAGQSAATAYGLKGYPYFIAVDAEGKVVMRGSGGLTEADISRIVSALKGTSS